MQQIKLGIDNGNYNTKSSDRMLYASGFATDANGFITPNMQLYYEGMYYAIGGKRMNFQQDKTSEPDTFILSLPAIANAMRLAKAHDADVALGVGLPIELYGSQRVAFREYFLRKDVHFHFEEEPFTVNVVDCKVFPQGHAALCKYFEQFKDYASITLVDIGGYTVDILAIHNRKPDLASCMSIRLGTITLFNDIRKVLQQQNIILPDDLIADAIQGHIEHSERKCIANVVSKKVGAYVKQLFNAMRERGIDLKLPTVFAGGGAELLGNHLKTDGINYIASLDRFANAEGYRLLMGE